jgi:hypothetical protein
MTYWCVNYVIAIDLARGTGGAGIGGSHEADLLQEHRLGATVAVTLLVPTAVIAGSGPLSSSPDGRFRRCGSVLRGRRGLVLSAEQELFRFSILGILGDVGAVSDDRMGPKCVGDDVCAQCSGVVGTHD